MIVIDTSALVAVLFQEAEMDRMVERIAASAAPVIATPTAFETTMVATRRHATNAPKVVREALDFLGIGIVAWGDDHLVAAQDAFARYGKGGGHPAQLNFGDCMAYALARILDAPLLFKGDDFSHTDIRPAL